MFLHDFNIAFNCLDILYDTFAFISHFLLVSDNKRNALFINYIGIIFSFKYVSVKFLIVNISDDERYKA